MRGVHALKKLILSLAIVVLASVPAAAGFWDQAIKTALWSAIATDRYQTEQWIDYTRSRPLTLAQDSSRANGLSGTVRCPCLYEANPILAGQREKLDPYFDWWATAVAAAPIDQWHPLTQGGAALLAAAWLGTIIHNNLHVQTLAPAAASAGIPLQTFAVIEYRIVF